MVPSAGVGSPTHEVDADTRALLLIRRLLWEREEISLSELEQELHVQVNVSWAHALGHDDKYLFGRAESREVSPRGPTQVRIHYIAHTITIGISYTPPTHSHRT